jgi:DNA polymerase III subunit epsilon
VSWWQRLARQPPALDAAQARRLARWRDLPRVPQRQSLEQARFVVLDTETSGLDMRKDRLLSIGAVAVRAGAVKLSEAFDCVLRQNEASADANIVIHGISGSEQLHGEPAPEALLRFLDYAEKDTLIAFHAHFDRSFIDGALRRHLGCASAGAWLDLAELLPALFVGVAASQLDEWLTHFGITPARRHSALGDAGACAQLLLIALSQARAKGIADLRALSKAAAQRHWLQQR